MSKGASRGRRRDAVRNRELLLDSARRLFRERGTKVSSLAITEGAGLAAGTLYRHFPTRDDLLAALSERSFGVALEHAREAAESGRPAPEALLLFLERTIERREELMMMPLHGGPLPLSDAAKELRAEIRVELDRVLARGREEGSIRPRRRRWRRDRDRSAACPVAAPHPRLGHGRATAGGDPHRGPSSRRRAPGPEVTDEEPAE